MKLTNLNKLANLIKKSLRLGYTGKVQQIRDLPPEAPRLALSEPSEAQAARASESPTPRSLTLTRTTP
eukprot:1373468-Rhodomonas_salina.1